MPSLIKSWSSREFQTLNLTLHLTSCDTLNSEQPQS
jgi:hypothetical protein